MHAHADQPPQIHPTSVVEPSVRLSPGVRVGAFCVLRGHVTIGPGTVIHDATHIHGITTIGQACQLGPAAYIGLDAQHLSYRGEPTQLVIGDRVTIRETATVHRSFRPGEEHATRIGDDCYLMGGVHVAHDCVIGRRVIAGNAVLLAGHCHIGDHAFLGGQTALHQHVRVGRLSIFAGKEGSSRDVPPFAAVRYMGLKAYNAIGCRRAGIPQPSLHAIRAAYQRIHTYRDMRDVVQSIEHEVDPVPEVAEIVAFIRESKRGIVPSVRFLHGAGHLRGAGDADDE